MGKWYEKWHRTEPDKLPEPGRRVLVHKLCGGTGTFVGSLKMRSDGFGRMVPYCWTPWEPCVHPRPHGEWLSISEGVAVTFDDSWWAPFPKKAKE